MLVVFSNVLQEVGIGAYICAEGASLLGVSFMLSQPGILWITPRTNNNDCT